MRESERRAGGEGNAPKDKPSQREPYEPPLAEDIDTTLGPAETAGGGPGISPTKGGVEESGRWH